MWLIQWLCGLFGHDLKNYSYSPASIYQEKRCTRCGFVDCTKKEIPEVDIKETHVITDKRVTK